MTEVNVAVAPQVKVVFPADFPFANLARSEQTFSMLDILRGDDNIATMSDATVKARVANHLDIEEGTLREMVVSRPETGNILLSPKAVFGRNTYAVSTEVTDEMVDELLNSCADADLSGRSKFPGMTYEGGVIAGIEWVLGMRDEGPME